MRKNGATRLPTPGARPIVCIGSSAGGLAGLKAIVGTLPKDFPWPILVAQHFPADVQSLLPKILARTSSLTIREAVEGERLAPGVVLTCPSDAEMGVRRNRTITLRARRRGHPGLIDHLFSTACLAAGPGTVAIVLSGMGWDGALGATAIKKRKGIVIAENPSTAEWGGMPAAAIKAGAVAKTLPSDEIGHFLMRLADNVNGA